MARRPYSRTRRALLVGLLTLAVYPLPKLSLPAIGAPRVASGSGRTVANEIVHAGPATAAGALTRPPSLPSGIGTGSTGGDTLLFTSQVVDGGQLFDFVGAHWVASRGAEDAVFVEIRTSRDGVGWSDWTTLERNEHLRDDDRNEMYAGPYAVDTARYVQYRVWLTSGDPDAVGRFALTLMDVSDLNASPVARVLNGVRTAFASLGPSTAAAAIGASRIYTRAEWGADESLMKWPPKYQRVQKAVIHHTVGSDGGTNVPAQIRSIYYFHAVTRGWGDIGYNYLVDKYGNIYVGRRGGDHVIAGHAYGWNNGTMGVAAIGDYSRTQPTSTMQTGIVGIVAMKFKQYGIQPFGADVFTHQEQNSSGAWINVTSSPPNVIGHRDANYIASQYGGQTACPGNGIYGMMEGLRRLMQGNVEAGYLQLPYLEPTLPKAGVPGTVVQVPLAVFNRGTTPIPAGTFVSYRIFKDATLVAAQGGRATIPTAIQPGGALNVTVPLTVPAIGNYLVRFDLQTGSSWWNTLYSTPFREVAFRGADWSADWISDTVPISWVAGETRVVMVTVQNDGGRVWPAGGTNPVRLGYKWVSNATGNTFPGANRTALPQDVQPGQTISLPIAVTAPVYPTNYTLILDLYKENEFAFADKGIAPDDTPTGVSIDFKATYSVPVGGVLSAPTFTAGQVATVPVVITNSGRGVFPVTSSYPVNLGYHWYDSAGRTVVWDGARTKLPADLGPGQSASVQAQVTAPTTPGTHSLRFDLVQEGVAWFSTKGVAPTDFTVNVQGQLIASYGADYTPTTPTLPTPNAQAIIPITLVNRSNFAWPAGGANPVRLSYHWASSGQTVVWDGLRTRLAADVAPGQSVQLQALVQFPGAPGLYTLRWDLVHEGVAWFSGKGAPTFDQSLAVQAAVEPFYGASIVADATPASMAPGAITQVTIKVQNLSNFDWGSDVNLSYHWYDASGRTVQWDGLRTALAGLRRNEVREVSAQVLAPAAGTYTLKFDIAREGVTWFSDRGMQMPARSVNVAAAPLGAAYTAPATIVGALNGVATAAVTIRNTGSATWQPGSFNLAYHLYAPSGNLYVWDGARTALPAPVAPGQSVTVNATIRVPNFAGSFRVAFDMVQEGVAWFSDRGVPTGSSTLQAQ